MKEANAIGGKTARPCDGCLKKRARWYCVADDAFLCQSCDSSVHSANPLASRHERVRLETASSVKDNVLFPVWCRKARTPRTKAKQVDRSDFHDNNPLVPDLEDGLEIGHHDFHDNLLCQVPTDDDLHGYLLPTDVDLADFAANVESLLGLDDDSGDTKGLDFLECKEENDDVGFFKEAMVKIKDEDHEGVIGNLCLDTDWGFEYSHLHEDVKGLIEVAEGEAEDESNTQSSDKIERNVHLRLNYDDVINAWASQGCPWTNGTRPDEFNLDECWPHCSSSCVKHVQHPFGVGFQQVGDGVREARVSRYREKRRTRLFSKKIRYEVRKLNAEKRPRMKGRFVKRTSLVGTV